MQPVPSVVSTGSTPHPTPPNLCNLPGSQRTWWCGEAMENPSLPFMLHAINTSQTRLLCPYYLIDIFSGRFLCHPKNPAAYPRTGPTGSTWLFSGAPSHPGAKVKVILSNQQEAAQALIQGDLWGTQPTCSDTSKHVWPHLFPSREQGSLIQPQECSSASHPLLLPA